MLLSPEIKPCPFCHGSIIHYVEISGTQDYNGTNEDEEWIPHMMCLDCDAVGPIEKFGSEEAWEKRRQTNVE